LEKWTADNISDQSGKVMIVTGANSGLGLARAMILAKKGATVVLACRNQGRGEAALAAIRAQVPAAEVVLLILDLASLASIAAFAAAFEAQFERLDVLLNNAGVSLLPRTETEDGFETIFGVNHLGHFALTGRLLAALLATPNSRVVTVSSRMHAAGVMRWDDLMGQQSYNKWEAYRQSKLANLLFAFERQRRLAAMGAPCLSLAAHPGFSDTNWAGNLGGWQVTLLRPISRWLGQTAADGALSQLYAAVDPAAAGGAYYGPQGGLRGEPVALRAGDAAYDKTAAQRLWTISEALTGVVYWPAAA